MVTMGVICILVHFGMTAQLKALNVSVSEDGSPVAN